MRSLTQTPRCLSSSGSVASAGALPFLPMGSGRPAQLGPGAERLGEQARERAELRRRPRAAARLHPRPALGETVENNFGEEERTLFTSVGPPRDP